MRQVLQGSPQSRKGIASLLSYSQKIGRWMAYNNACWSVALAHNSCSHALTSSQSLASLPCFINGYRVVIAFLDHNTFTSRSNESCEIPIGVGQTYGQLASSMSTATSLPVQHDWLEVLAGTQAHEANGEAPRVMIVHTRVRPVENFKRLVIRQDFEDIFLSSTAHIVNVESQPCKHCHHLKTKLEF